MIMSSSEDEDHFTYSFLLCLSFLFLASFYQLGLVKCWINMGRINNLALFPILKKSIHSFISKYISWGLFTGASSISRKLSYNTSFLRIFIMNRYWILSNSFPVSIGMNMFLFLLFFFISNLIMNYIDWFSSFNQP